MNYRQHLIALMETFAAAKGISPGRVGQILFSSGAKYDQLVAGADINVGRFEDAVKYLDAHWPDDLPWPEGLARPSLSPAHSNDEAA
jgi:hypothetical protein